MRVTFQKYRIREKPAYKLHFGSRWYMGTSFFFAPRGTGCNRPRFWWYSEHLVVLGRRMCGWFNRHWPERFPLVVEDSDWGLSSTRTITVGPIQWGDYENYTNGVGDEWVKIKGLPTQIIV